MNIQSNKVEPLFIVGCHRSGTTLLQVLLDAKSSIAIPPESHIFDRIGTSFKHYTNLDDKKNLRTFVNDLISDGMLKSWDLNISVDDFCKRLDNPSIPNCINLLFRIYAERENKIRWGDKTPNNIFHLDQISSYFPNAKFIHIIRDGRDVAQSQLKVWFGPKTIYHNALKWKTYLSAFDAFKKKTFNTKYREIRYEDLVNNPEDQINDLLNFLGEPGQEIDRDIPDTYRKNLYIKRGQEYSSLSEPITKQKISTYKNAFSQRQINLFEAIAGDELTKHGYERISNEKLTITVLDKFFFTLKDKLFRVLFKLNQPYFFRKELQRVFRSFLRRFKRR